MSVRKEQEKLQAERHQLIIQELLRDEDNKYCVDCDAKGPRWASWNIGVFLCIRCAGIHRNLGVHISKVKSVNLDTWTIPQLAMMREMGNSRARAIYEAKLPDNFRRPQSDSALETFIRSKYEQKRYIASEYVPIKPDVDALVKEIQRLEQSSKKRHTSNTVTLPSSQSQSMLGKPPSSKITPNPLDSTPKDKTVDLLGLNTPDVEPTSSGDNFTPFTSGLTLNTPGGMGLKPMSSQPTPPNTASFTNATQVISEADAAGGNGGAALDLLGLNFGGSSSGTTTNIFEPVNPDAQPSLPVSTTTTNAKCSKESILALYQQYPPPTGLFQPTGTIPTPAAYSQYSGLTPPTNWAFGGAAAATNTDPWANGPKAPGFTDRLQTGNIPTFSSPANVSQPTTGVKPFTLQPESAAQSAITFQQPSGITVGSNIPDWPVGNTSWSTSIPSTPANLFGSLGTPVATGGRTNIPTWNSATGPINAGTSVLGTPNFFTPNAMNPTTVAHQAYLSQVQSQLASLQLGATVNHQP